MLSFHNAISLDSNAVRHDLRLHVRVLQQVVGGPPRIVRLDLGLNWTHELGAILVDQRDNLLVGKLHNGAVREEVAVAQGGQLSGCFLLQLWQYIHTTKGLGMRLL